jgi:sulfate adenylyltransferase large subunit
MSNTANKLDIKAFLDQDERKDLLRLLTAGSVDDGKSTLIGRLLFDSKKIYEDQLSALERDSKRMGHAGDNIDYALLLDGLKAEREQGITIDVAYRYFSTNKRKFIIADTPGHEQYTRNMVTGASTANLAIILIDATKGVITQTRRHTFLVSLLGIRHVALAVNKMDLVDYNEQVFNNICADYAAFVAQLDIPDVHYIPLSALKGDNVVEPSGSMPWYSGKCMLDFLETIEIGSDRNFTDMRYPVQFVLRPDRDFRGFSAKVASGVIRKGRTVMALPSCKTSTIKSIVTYDGELDEAFPPQSVTVTLNDEIDISRGEMLVYPDNLPAVNRRFTAMLVWMDEKTMAPDTQFFIKHANNTTRAHVDKILYRIDVNTLEKKPVKHFALNEIGYVSITAAKPLFFDPYRKNRATGSFVLIDPVTNYTAAVGMIVEAAEDAADADTARELFADFQPAFERLDALENETPQTVSTEETFELNCEAVRAALKEWYPAMSDTDLLAEGDDRQLSAILTLVQEAYSADVEERAVGLLWAICVYRPFCTSNYRIAAQLFLWYLNGNGILYATDGHLLVDGSMLQTMIRIIHNNPTVDAEESVIRQLHAFLR